MSGMRALSRALAIPVLIGFVASGCAAGRSVLDINVPEATAPQAGPAVRIVAVRDQRKFEVNPLDPSKPSIGNIKEVGDANITSHAIGRKRNGWGNAMGDIALPESKTAASLVRDAVRTALQRRGYRTVDEGSAEYAQALPLTVDVDQFWAWMKPGFAELTLSLESQVTLTGRDVVSSDPAVVVGHYSNGTAAAFEKVWAAMIQAGVEDLIGKIEQNLRPTAGIAAGQGGAAPLRASADLGS